MAGRKTRHGRGLRRRVTTTDGPARKRHLPARPDHNQHYGGAIMAELTVNNDQSKSKGTFCPTISMLADDLSNLLVKFYVVEEYAMLVQKRDNVACGLDGVSLILGNLTTELGEIIDRLRRKEHD